MHRLRSVVIFAAAALTLTGQASFAQGTASVCENPTFRVPVGSPFPLTPKPGVPGLPKALAAGNFFKRTGTDAACGCDLTIALGSDTAGGFVALLRGNDDGTFAQKFAAALPSGEAPMAIVKGRFKIEGSAGLDSVAVATSNPSEPSQPGRVRLFIPDENGSYSESRVSWPAGRLPVAMTTGDFNGDGRLDVAVANNGNRTLTILFGTAAGQFSETDIATVPLGQGIPNSLAAGRFSGAASARDDIAVGTLVPDPADPAARRAAVVVVRRNAAGAFAAGAPIIVGAKNSFAPWVTAANLTLPAGAVERPWRDLAVALLDRDAAGNPIGRVKVLLGRDSGDFNAAQTHDLGAALPRSATVADLDDDGVVDLIVSTHGDTLDELNGTIRFFQGKISAGAGFHVNPQWFNIPATVGIRPQSIAAGRFGPKIQRPDGTRANMGLAAANAPGLRTIAVFFGNGRGSFVQPTVVTTPLPRAARLLVSGDFHSPSGADPLHDLAYVSGSGLSILLSNGAGGFTKLDGVPIPVGSGPHIAAASNFDGIAPTDIAVIDTSPDDATGSPFVKILTGKGDGTFDIFEFPLEPGERPVAMATGRFSGQAKGAPLDIVVVSDTTLSGSATTSGRLTLLVNNKQGRFPKADRRSTPLPFAPAAIAASDKFRAGGRFDVVVRDANEKRFIFLLNLGFAEPGESQFKSGGFFGGTGEAFELLVGEIPEETRLTEKRHHIVTFDRDTTIKVFVSDGSGSFTRREIARPGGDFVPRPPYVIADFGDGRPGLAAPAVKDEVLGIVQLKGDGQGGFTFAHVHMEPGVPRGDPIDPDERTAFEQTIRASSATTERIPTRGLAGQFRSALHGNNKPDVALITQVKTTSIKPGTCPRHQIATPEPERPRSCRPSLFLEFDECRGLGLPPGCSVIDTDAPCCMCPGIKQCPNSCDASLERPFHPFCTTTQLFAHAITVFANTCGD